MELQVEVEVKNTIDATPDATSDAINSDPPKKKRGRKPKPKPLVEEPVIPKKRGRKPKGGKIINNPLEKSMESEYVTENVILHLKCNSQDIENSDSTQIESHDTSSIPFHLLDEINENVNDYVKDCNNEEYKIDTQHTKDIAEMKTISDKIIELQKNFYFNDIQTTNSACFWCTCDFDHTSVHIPKYKMNDQYHVYGCFCCPECAVAYLYKEQLDGSQKYERYLLLNFLYNKVFDIVTSIKPAPDPHYMLDKFMGNMTIQEYRKLLRQDRLFIVVDKPITRILPEVYEESDLKSSHLDGYNKSSTSFQIKTSDATNKMKGFFS